MSTSLIAVVHDQIGADSEYQARARLLQWLWRQRQQLAPGEHNGRLLGSRLPMPDAQHRLTNFLTDTVRAAVRREMKGLRGSGKLIKVPRIYDALRGASAGAWVEAFQQRYLDFDSVQATRSPHSITAGG